MQVADNEAECGAADRRAAVGLSSSKPVFGQFDWAIRAEVLCGCLVDPWAPISFVSGFSLNHFAGRLAQQPLNGKLIARLAGGSAGAALIAWSSNWQPFGSLTPNYAGSMLRINRMRLELTTEGQTAINLVAWSPVIRRKIVLCSSCLPANFGGSEDLIVSGA
jgi:hypothetical protein